MRVFYIKWIHTHIHTHAYTFAHLCCFDFLISRSKVSELLNEVFLWVQNPQYYLCKNINYDNDNNNIMPL